MPLYEYQCARDGRFEVIRKFSDPPLKKCPQCGGPIQKLLSAPAIQFKGTGWYVTDYAKKSGGEGSKGEGPKGEGSKGEGSKGEGSKGTESGKSGKEPSSSSAASESSGADTSDTGKSESKKAASSGGKKS